MNRKLIIGTLVVLLVILGAAAVGYFAYNAGVAQATAALSAGEDVPRAWILPYHLGRGGGWGHTVGGFYPWGPVGAVGFVIGGLIRLFVVVLFIALLIAFVRIAFRASGFWGHRGRWGEKGVPPMFEEWHKRAHGESGGTSQG